MTRIVSLVAGLLVVAGLASAPAGAASPPARGKAAATCTPDEPAFWRDQGLTTKVATKLQFHKPLLREKIEVKVTGNAALLSGNVSSAELIATAVKVASAVGGIKCVQNHLKVGPPLNHGQTGGGA